ncbi:MotA/TolQ/ExbB proton channel family protein [Bacteroidota bacterium]
MAPDEFNMTFLQMLGEYKWSLLPLALLIIVLAIYDAFLIANHSNQNRIKNGLTALLVTGSICAALGIFAQIHGIWEALEAIMEAADISPQIVMYGLKVSFASTLFGLGSLVVSGLFWLILSAWNAGTSNTAKIND